LSEPLRTRMNVLKFGSIGVLTWQLFAFCVAFKCHEPNGIYEHPHQCDKYYECSNNAAEEKLCPDGLVFDLYSSNLIPCDHQFIVDCGNRTELQPPQPKGPCPRLNGFYRHPDESICHQFYTCTDGLGVKMNCPTGLHFDEIKGTCVWPAQAGRVNCGEKEVLSDGFKCPKDETVDQHGLKVPHPRFAHPEDCQKFYVCLNGVSPREQGCTLGEVYSELKKTCVDPEDEPGCEDWYKDHPQFKAFYEAEAKGGLNDNRKKFIVLNESHGQLGTKEREAEKPKQQLRTRKTTTKPSKRVPVEEEYYDEA